jgi:phosphoribosylglycinamide formyltransferase-1
MLYLLEVAIMLRCAVLVSGRGSNLDALFQAEQRGELPVEFVLVATDRPGAVAIEKARMRGVPTWEAAPQEYPSREAFFSALADVIQQANAALVLLAGFMRILPAGFIDRFPAIMNIHPALLPAFPGLHAQRQALEYGVRYAGCTVHFVDHGVDSGPIIAQAVVPVLPDDDEESLSARILIEEHKLYPACVRLYAEGRLQVEGRKVSMVAP